MTCKNQGGLILRLLAISTVLSGGSMFAPRQLQAAGFPYASVGAVYSQNFDTLPRPTGWGGPNVDLGDSPRGWIDDSSAHDPPTLPSATGPVPEDYNFSLTGWYLWHQSGFNQGGFNRHQRFRNGSGGMNTGSFYSFGSSNTDAERALGILNSGTIAPEGQYAYIGLRLKNNTGATLTEFTLSYVGEQWRADNANAQKLEFAWKVGAAAVQESGFNAVSALDFTSPVLGTGNGLGNSTGQLAIGPVTVTGINWAPGTDLWLRWADVNDGGADHGLAIDDVMFSAIPEPSSFALTVLAALGAAVVQRKRSANRN